MVFCEGKVSERDYINGLKRLPEVRTRTSVDVQVDPQVGVPLTLVERAVARKRTDDEIDECWCVFDVEWPQHHPNLDRAVQLASTKGIPLAISNPCFELWLILHLKAQTAFLDTNEARSRSQQLDGRTGKGIDPSIYLPHRQIASERAASLVTRHKNNETTFPNDNPGSTMFRLLAAVEGD